jgi:hypothetical protein
LEYAVSHSYEAFVNFIRGLGAELEIANLTGEELTDLIQFLKNSKIFQLYFPEALHEKMFFQAVINAVNVDIRRVFRITLNFEKPYDHV